MKTVDIVVPCYNEQEVLETFYRETDAVVSQISGYSFRYIFVDDGSKDGTLNEFKKLSALHPQVNYISFSRNFGKEAGIYAGLEATTGDYVIVMDADLQHPPAMIPDMIKGIEEGHDCVAARRSTRKGEKKIRSWFSSEFYKLSNHMSDVKMEEGAVDYRIMSRQMIDSIMKLCEKQRFSKGIFMWVGFDTKWIPYENVERTIGTTKWSFKSLLKYALDGILSFSVSPLRLVSILGMIISFFAFIFIMITVIKTLITGIDVPGYTTLLCSMLFLGGIIEMSVGILGEYISRIYMEVKNRPIYIAKETKLNETKNDKSLE